jgi:lauroyl/myristoyl acyltransferase
MYRPLNNTYLDRWYRKQRQARGAALYSRRDGFHKPVDFVRSGGMLAVLADQKMRQGPSVPFMGREVTDDAAAGAIHAPCQGADAERGLIQDGSVPLVRALRRC